MLNLVVTLTAGIIVMVASWRFATWLMSSLSGEVETWKDPRGRPTGWDYETGLSDDKGNWLKDFDDGS